MIRGTVIWVDLTDATPREMGPSWFPIRCKTPRWIRLSLCRCPRWVRRYYRLRVKVHASGLKAAGYAVVPGQLKKSRIVGAAGRVKTADLVALDDAIRAYLS